MPQLAVNLPHPLNVGGLLTPRKGVIKRSPVTALGTVGTIAVDCAKGDYFSCAPTGNVTLAIANPPPAGIAQTIRVLFVQDTTARTATFPASFIWEGGTVGALSTAAGARDELIATTDDGGTTWRAELRKAFSGVGLNGVRITQTHNGMHYPGNYSATPNVAVPGKPVAGDLAYFCFDCGTARMVGMTWPPGFTMLEQCDSSNPGSVPDSMIVAERVCDGTESGTWTAQITAPADWLAIGILVHGNNLSRESHTQLATDSTGVAAGTPVAIAGPAVTTLGTNRLVLWFVGTSTGAATSGHVDVFTPPAGFVNYSGDFDEVDEFVFLAAGIEPAAGTKTYSAQATFTGSNAHMKYVIPVVIAIDSTPTPMGLTGDLPDGTVGVPYSAQLTVTGDYIEPVTPGLVTGALPSWMSAAYASGKVTYSGTPDAAATSTFTPKVTDSTTPTAQTANGPAQSVTIADPTPMGLTGDLPDGTFGVAYSAQLTVTGSYVEPVTPGVAAGTKPAWMSASYAAGKVTYSGTPNASGAIDFTPKVTDSTTPTAQTANGPQQLITIATGFALTGDLPDGTVGSAYSAQLTVSGDYVEPVTPGLVTGSLPSWMTAAYSAGKVTYSGTPDAAATSNFTPKVTDSSGTPQVANGPAQSVVVSSGGGHVGVVQNTGLKKAMGNNPSNVGFTFTPATPFTAGNKVILSYTWYDPQNSISPASAVVTINGTAATLVGSTRGSEAKFTTAIWYGTAGSGSAGAKIVWPSGTVNSIYIVGGGIECDDIDTLDQTASATGTSTSITATTPALAQANERIYTACEGENGRNVGITLDAADTLIYQDTDGINEVPGTSGYRSASGSAAQTITWTPASSMAWGMVTATFKLL